MLEGQLEAFDMLDESFDPLYKASFETLAKHRDTCVLAFVDKCEMAFVDIFVTGHTYAPAFVIVHTFELVFAHTSAPAFGHAHVLVPALASLSESYIFVQEYTQQIIHFSYIHLEQIHLSMICSIFFYIFSFCPSFI